MDMLFVRGDGVILVSSLLLLPRTGVNRDFVGLTALKNIAGYRHTDKLNSSIIIIHGTIP